MSQAAKSWPIALTLVGCAPSTMSLMQSRNFDDAVCSVDRHTPAPERRAVLEGLERAIEPAVHVRAVRQSELEPALGRAAAQTLLEKAAVLSLVVQTNRAPLATTRVALAVIQDAKPLDELTKRSQIAAVFGESLPRPTKASYGPGEAERIASSVQDTAALATPLLTLGLVHPNVATHWQHGTYERAPSDEEYLVASPKTETLFRNLVNDERCGEPGSTCRDLLALPRPTDESGPTSLRFTVTYGSVGIDGRFDRCELSHEVEVPLPPGPTIEARLERLFGKRTVLVRVLADDRQ